MKDLTLESPLTALPGIGKTRAEAFAALGVFTVCDLLYHFPRAYENRGDIRPVATTYDGLPHSFSLVVGTAPRTARLRRGMTVTKFRAFDESGTVEMVFFNQPYTASLFSPGAEFRFYGRLTEGKKYPTLTNPAYEPLRADLPLPDMVARYPAGEKLSSKLIASAVEAALGCLSGIVDFLPENIRQKYEFPTLATAIKTVHTPLNHTLLRPALDRLAFDEYLLFALGLSFSANRSTAIGAPRCTRQNISPLLALLPYSLTDDQKSAIREIAHDMSAPNGTPMNRILVGDVGCGKTVCAAAAAYIALLNGKQAAIMAPTEILARQHYRELSRLFEALGYRTALLLGSTPDGQKRKIYDGIATDDPEHRIDLLIGTHALLNDRISFYDLGLTVTDEQHRFGVLQRTAIREKNPTAHLLVMSATPIPRTLALVLYGDLDISRIEELPKGRIPIETLRIKEALRPRLNDFIRRTVEEGGQVYIVCPAIEEDEEETLPLAKVFLPGEDEAPPLKTAVEYSEMLATVFPEFSLAYLHGRMKPAEKDAVMSRFSEGKIDILVSTTVIEVGINVPNASLMVVENAERFGLSQLHQLRGRVGRGERKSYCILVSDATGDAANQRLSALCRTSDGFQIAEEDLRLRGPGDFLADADGGAIRQSGGLRLSRIAAAAPPHVSAAAFAEARALLAEDPALAKDTHLALAEQLRTTFSLGKNTVS